MRITINKKKNDAYCIRCGEHIPFNHEKPYCSSCFSTWIRYEDLTYPENYCHKCGNLDDDISMVKPLCFSCWKNWKNPRVIPF